MGQRGSRARQRQKVSEAEDEDKKEKTEERDKDVGVEREIAMFMGLLGGYCLGERSVSRGMGESF